MYIEYTKKSRRFSQFLDIFYGNYNENFSRLLSDISHAELLHALRHHVRTVIVQSGFVKR